MSVSVIISVRNGEPFIADAIHSALAQGDCIKEIIVVNDRSTDNTSGVVKALGNPKVRVIPATRRGLPAGRNIGADVATSEWLYFLDADDLVRPGAVPKLLEAAEKDADAAIIYGDYDRVDEEGKKLGRRRYFMAYGRKPSGDILRNLLKGNLTVVGAQIVKRSVYKQAGKFDESMKVSDDWHFWCRAAAVCKFRFVPNLYVVSYRVHRASIIHTRPLPFDAFLPAIDSVYENNLIRSRIAPEELSGLRAKCEAAKLGYISSTAVRLSAYKDALSLALRSFRRSPVTAPRTLVRVAGAFIGL